MTITRRDLLAGASASAALAALPTPATAAASVEERAQAFIAAVAEEQLADNPENASALGLDTGERYALRARLVDRTPAGVARNAAHLRARLRELKAFDGAAVTPDMRVHLDVIRASFDSALTGFAFPYGDVAVGGWRNSPYTVIQNVGAFLDVPRLLDSTHKVENTADAEAYLQRLASYADQLDGETERVRAATGHGAIPPDFLLDKALSQLAQTRSGDPATWDVVTSLAKRTAAMPGDFARRAAKMAAAKLAPALDRQIAALQAQRKVATGDAGVWHLPQGDAYYAWALAAGTTTTMPPDQVHRDGMEELAKLQAEMDVILRSIGYTRGTVGARMTALGKDPRYQFPDNDDGRAQITALLRDRITDIRGRMPQAFRTLVPGNVEVKRLPLAEEPGAPGAYGGPGTIDGSIPGRLWINLRTTDLWRKYSLPDLAYHEAIPGHVWQGEYGFKMPLIRAILQFNAYSEGWALYGEQLADELGVYAEDPVARLGYLQSLAFRACRMVVDTGLHAKRWTRAHAIEWFATTNGSGLEEVSGEVDRYCSWPGQACGYKVGHTAINLQRLKGQTELGQRYDLRDFNDAAMLGGNVPMTVLSTVIDRYIVAKRA
jgi:uncharacterized protein (DUF885 family)